MAVPINYELPPAVRAIQQSWRTSLKNSAIISAFLAAVAFQSLKFFKDKANFDPTIQNSEWSPIALSIISYTSLFLNLGACGGTFVLLEYIGLLPFHAGRKPGLQTINLTSSGPQGILQLFGIGRVWRWLLWHWLFCFIFGFLSVFTLILSYVWLQEPKETKIAITVFGAFGLIPIFTFFLSPFTGCFRDISASISTVSSRCASPIAALTPQRSFNHISFSSHPPNRNSGTIQDHAYSSEPFPGSPGSPPGSKLHLQISFEKNQGRISNTSAV